ncbi:hypothetical protein ACIQD3_02005 [Peribacillus loiseleuriae]|uniref:hypothetical protein n=1 Tax=Peribacillus loiseleuriae TaxID=1679170 RepID=UPI003800F3D4
MSKPVYCDKCSREIKYRGDLITATILFEVIPYHEDCYAKDLKSAKMLFLDNQPLNGFSSNFVTIIAILLGIGWLIFAEGFMKWAAIIPSIQVIYRIYSFFSYERQLEK